MIHIIPYDKWKLETKLTVDEAMEKIKSITEVGRWESLTTDKAFVGKVDGDTFKIRPNVAVKNRLPVLYGKVVDREGIACIEVVSTDNSLLKIIDATCFVLICVCVIAGVVGVFKGGSMYTALTGVGLLVLDLVNVNVVFGIRLQRAKEKIEEVMR